MTDKQKNIALKFTLAAVMLLVGLFIGRETKICKSGTTVINTRVDTIIAVVPPVVIHDTISKYRKIYLPGDVDSSLDNLLFKEREELLSKLDSMKVKSEIKIDTLIGETKDTVKVRIDEIKETVDIYLGLSPRKVTVDTQVVYLPPPKREWWDNPYVPGIGGVIIGFILGVLK